MRQTGTLMMNSVKWFVKERESNQPPQPAFRDDAPSCAIYRVARHPNVLDVFAPTLQISRQDCRREIHPEEIFPQAECCDRPENKRPGHNCQRQFRPNALANALASDRRRRTKEGSQENKRRINQSEIQLEKCGQTSLPPWHGRLREWPKFVISLRREISMMGLMNDAIEAETHQTQRADHDSIELIEAAIFSEKPVRGLVQTDEHAVHQMAGNKHERHRQPDQSAVHRYSEHRLQRKPNRKREAETPRAIPSAAMHLAEIFVDGGGSLRSVQHFRDSVLRRAADARQNSLKYAIETFNVTSGKQILAKKPRDFQAFAGLQ